MRAIPLDRTGPPSVLRVQAMADPVPRYGEVVVRIRRIGINYAEILSRKGLYGWAPRRPYIPGMEASGEIESTGPGVDHALAGKRVIVAAQYGCYAERIAVPLEHALMAIDDFSIEENAAFAVNYMTAWIALFEMARLRPADTVLVTAAAGGVGTAAVQLASAFGCRVLGAVGSAAKIDTVRPLGASHAFEYTALEDEVRHATDGRGVDVALELVGSGVYRTAYRSLAPLGRVVIAGFASRPALQRWNPLSWYRTWRAMPKPYLMEMLQRSLAVASTHIGYLLPERELVQSLWSDLTKFRAAHGIRPIIGAQFDFDEMPQAHAFIESRRSVGKVIVRID
jgi:NADPH:quinone reductase-like Zn-dependent oxidoreductase